MTICVRVNRWVHVCSHSYYMHTHNIISEGMNTVCVCVSKYMECELMCSAHEYEYFIKDTTYLIEFESQTHYWLVDFLKLLYILSCKLCRGKNSWKFSKNSEVFALEFQENIEEIFPLVIAVKSLRNGCVEVVIATTCLQIIELNIKINVYFIQLIK